MVMISDAHATVPAGSAANQALPMANLMLTKAPRTGGAEPFAEKPLRPRRAVQAELAGQQLQAIEDAACAICLEQLDSVPLTHLPSPGHSVMVPTRLIARGIADKLLGTRRIYSITIQKLGSPKRRIRIEALALHFLLPLKPMQTLLLRCLILSSKP